LAEEVGLGAREEEEEEASVFVGFERGRKKEVECFVVGGFFFIEGIDASHRA
jgi:hypothetical protein